VNGELNRFEDKIAWVSTDAGVRVVDLSIHPPERRRTIHPEDQRARRAHDRFSY
jgi:hypothetical protein